ncbi:MAG TPA: cation-translocating P-type ATPase [Clostridiaceae bacterium]|nr:cation-translocating P-type ATPase [Clostridium sp.]MEE0127350.1 cation-translocating P-type ATPase [Clostridia bacterium]HJJ12675.1 cation-translocating P-type ATPase [Clostridiaceae bacterium]
MEKESLKGLTNKQVEERIKDGKVNKVEDNKTRTNWEIIRDNVCTLFNLFNLLIAIALIAVKAYTNLAYMLIIVVNIIIGVVQEIHARNLVQKLSVLKVSKANVIRDGKEKEINIDEIVIDDLIVLDSGKQICADSVVMSGEVEVNESLLTGESDTILKQKGDKLLSGSYVVSGKCYSKVEKVGKDNFAEQITSETKKYKRAESELVNSMKKVTNFTSFVIIPVGLILFVQAYFFRNVDITNSVVSTAAALLGMLPKGLMLLITISLATGVIKLAKKRVLVQDLYSVETLAHIDTLCLDKTGTITEGRMKVDNVKIYNEKCMPHPMQKMMVAFVNEMSDNNATFMALKDYYKGEDKFEIEDNMAFSSERKWSSISFKGIGSIVLGAPERLIEKSKMEMPEEVVTAQKAGKRMLFVGYSKETVSDENLPNLEIVASITLDDPLRKNAKEMLGFFKTQSVDIKIISGDNPLTVSSIAKKAGLESYDSYIDLSTINSDDQIPELVDKYSVFARVMPHQKSLIVKALQEKGHSVAMTGDGVNDVVALKQADCSITLPEASDIARQVSQIVLLNSDFSVLKDVLMEGRRVVNNITNVARIFFIKTIYSMLLALFNIVTNTAFPFIPIQITLIDLAIEGYTSFFLSFLENSKPLKGTFLRTVIRNALPYALTIIISIILITFTRSGMGLNIEESHTLMYLIIGGVSIFAVIEACRPFNRISTFLCTTTAVGFFFAAILFKKLLHLTAINEQVILILGASLILAYIVVTGLKYLINNLSNDLEKARE